jgi:hypothetical protein
MFYLARIEPNPSTGGHTESPLENYGPFKRSLDAAKMAKNATRLVGMKVLPRRMANAPDWRPNWRTKMESGEIKLLPAEWDLEPIEDHFAHISSRNWGLIAFIENSANGVVSKITEIKPGRYLQRFYPNLSENDRKKYASIIDDGNAVQFATTADDIEWVYENGPKSCMKRIYHTQDDEDFDSPFHPVRVYAAGDLAVAWTKSETGRVKERCLVWPEKKLFGRTYGDGSGRLVAELKEQGYLSAFANGSAQRGFVGARLARHVVELRRDQWFVCPHVDAGASEGTGGGYVYDDGTHLIISGNDCHMRANETKGLILAVIADQKMAA